MYIKYKWLSINTHVEKDIEPDELAMYEQWEKEGRIKIIAKGEGLDA